MYKNAPLVKQISRIPSKFESRVQLLHGVLFVDVAQLVEQKTENLRVAGSIPAVHTYRAYSTMVGHSAYNG